MKRPAASDSIITPFFSSEERGEMMPEEEEDDDEICCGGGGGGGAAGGLKKRRLGTEQVRALERCFDIENKLDPERKARLAQELGLQPRQVAVWFQNRRARWKTKQLERDFAALKSRYDALRLDFDSLRRDNHALLAELAGLKSKLGAASAAENELAAAAGKQDEEKVRSLPPPPPAMVGDGSCDSDSSVVLAEENRLEGGIVYQAQQMFKMEEHSFFGVDSAAFFSDEHVPNFGWFGADLNGGGGGAGGGWL